MNFLFYSLLAIITFCFVIFGGVVATGSEDAIRIFVAFCCWGILLLPQYFQFQREKTKYDLLQPFNFVIVLSLLGVFAQTIFLLTTDEITQDSILLGKDSSILEPALFGILVGLICFIIGYYLDFIPAFNLERLPIIRNRTWEPRRLLFISVIMTIFSLIIIAVYLQKIGIFSEVLANPIAYLMTKKRLVVEGSDYQYSSLKYLRWGASLLTYEFYFLFALFASSKKKIFSPLGILALTFGLIASLFPLIAGSRSGILIHLVYGTFIWHYLRERLTRRNLFVLIAISLILLILLGSLRAINQGQVTEFSEYSGTLTILDGRRWFNVVRTALIIDGVPDNLDYQYGKTFLTWLVAPIPREIWVEKPIIRIGPILGTAIFQRDLAKTGVPPGYLAELYLNFGFWGISVGMFLLGLWLKFLYKTFRDWISHNRNAILLYMVIIFPFSFNLLASDISGIMVNCLINFFSIYLILIFISKPKSNYD